MTSHSIYQYVAGFPPEIGTSHLEYELALGLSQRGHRVTVFTMLPRRMARGSRMTPKAYSSQLMGGARVVRFQPRLSGNPSLASKGLDYFVSGISLSQPLAFLKKPSVMIVSSPPLTMAFSAVLQGMLRGIPVVLRIGDIHPDSLTDVGVGRGSLLFWLLSKMERFVYEHSRRITVLSQEQVDYLVGKGVDGSKIEVVHLWASDDVIHHAQAPKEDVLQGIGHQGRKIFFYGGSLSFYQDLDTILDAAKALSGEPALFIIMGSGPMLGRLTERVKAESLKNVVLLPPQPKERYLQFLGASDAAFAAMGYWAKTPTIPSKTLEIMAMGKPVIALCTPGSALANLVTRTGAGVVVPSRDGRALSEKIMELMGDEGLRRELGRRGRGFVERHGNIDCAVESYERLIEEIYAK